jgi:hypothetical protein
MPRRLASRRAVAGACFASAAMLTLALFVAASRTCGLWHGWGLVGTAGPGLLVGAAVFLLSRGTRIAIRVSAAAWGMVGAMLAFGALAFATVSHCAS